MHGCLFFAFAVSGLFHLMTLESSGSVPFRGFEVRAHRTEGDTEEIVGQFVSGPSDGKSIYYYPQIQGTKNCISHDDNSDKYLVTAEWRAPTTAVGDIVLKASFVKDYETFWLDITQTLRSESGNDDLPFMYGTTTTVEPISLSGCGDTKGCLLWPAGCDRGGAREDCAYAVTWSSLVGNTGFYQFEMYGPASGYLALGFSDNKRMADSHVISCVVSDPGNMVQHVYCPKRYCERHRITGVVRNQVAKSDDTIHCRFQRPTRMTLTQVYDLLPTAAVETPKEFDISSNGSYMFLGWGSVYEGSDSLMHHEQLPIVSYSKIDFSKNQIYYGQQLPTELKIHASFGVVGWMLLVGFSIIVARHGKQILGADCCNSKAWLRTHQICMVLGFVLSATGIIVIFVYLKIWTEYATVHAILGLVAIGLSLIQIVAGFARPNPGTKFRRVWTWLHRLEGIVAFLLAGVCVVLGFNVQLLEDVLRRRQLIISLVWLAYHIIFDFIFEITTFNKKTTKVSEKKSSDDQVKIIKSSTPQKLVFALYVLGLLALTSLCLTFIALA